MALVIQLTQGLTLNKNSETYSRVCNQDNFYYEAFEMNVPQSGTYIVWSDSDIDTYGYIYVNNFDRLNPNENLLINDNDGQSNLQFRIEILLHVNTTYLLVVTTFRPNVIGHIKINLWGLTNVNIKRISE